MELNRKKIIPHLKQKNKIPLYETSGRVLTVLDFIKENLFLLKKNEQIFIKKQLNHFSRLKSKYFKNPLTVVRPNKNSFRLIKTRSVGSRSAFWPEKKLKFKGCKPKPDLYFPHEQLNFDEKKMTVKKIIFGALSAENVMREILAFCFLKSNRLSTFQKPLCVFEYHHKNKPIGYCLVSQSLTEKRLESKENLLDLTVKDLIFISQLQNKFNIQLIKNQAGFKGIKEDWYNEQKSKLMIKMNFKGGFRGILNSNLGNDIVYKNKFYICDFDTFKVVQMPQKADYKFIKNFVLWCVAEMLKTSPLILDYVNIEKMSDKQTARKLWGIYYEKSSFWQSYYGKFLNQAKILGWDLKLVNKAVDKAINAKVVHELLLDNVLNSKVIQETYKPELSFYIPH